MDYKYWASRADLAPAADVAEVDLVCASGLPPTGDLDVDAILRDLDNRADIIGAATRRAVRTRGNDPAYDNLSDSHFRIVCLGSMLRKMGVTRHTTIVDRVEFDHSDCRDYFIHELFNGHPASCVPMAVIFTAIGRRLAYPVKLVHATRHQFCRWEGSDGERFNFEPTSFGQHSYPDDYYRTWPFTRPKSEMHLLRFLRSLTPREELASSICKRSHTFMENLLMEEAEEAAYWATKICPDDPSYREDWEAAIMVCRAMPEIRRRKTTDPYEVGLYVPTPVKAWEGEAYYVAKSHLTRIYRNLQRRAGENFEAGYAERAKLIEESLFTRIDTCSMQVRTKK